MTVKHNSELNALYAARLNAKKLEHLVEMSLDGPRIDLERYRNLSVIAALKKEIDDLTFAQS